MAGFHEGELAVQRRAGVDSAAARLSPMLAPAELRGGLVRFLADRTFAALTAADEEGRLWVSPLAGAPGFLRAVGATTLEVNAAPLVGDPLHDIPVGQQVGLLVIEFATRRRVRINGTLTRSAGGLRIEVEQAYGNCPQYIQQRLLALAPAETLSSPVRRGGLLSAEDIGLIRAADTLVVGSRHATRGADASHRGGAAGFVRVEDAGHLWWPDYAGNNMFNTMGNIEADPGAALLFPDFVSGRTVQVSGSASIEWVEPGSAGDDDLTGRRVRFTVTDVVAGHLLPVHADYTVPYDLNPPLS